jgi:uncharacterized damage-inducible protein DinB
MRFRNDIQRILAYHSWSRAKYLDLYARLPWEVLVRNREATFGSIRNVHLHVLAVYAGWLAKMFGRRSLDPIVIQLDEKKFDRIRNVAQLRDLDRTVDKELMAVSATTSASTLRRKHWSVLHGMRYAWTEEEGLWHMIEEDFLHRGEIICMLWQDDIEPPYTGYMWWEAETDPEGHRYLPYRHRKTKPSAGGYVQQRMTVRRR